MNAVGGAGHDHAGGATMEPPDDASRTGGAGGGDAGIQGILNMEPTQILDFIQKQLMEEQGGASAPERSGAGDFSVSNPEGATPNQKAMGMEDFMTNLEATITDMVTAAVAEALNGGTPSMPGVEGGGHGVEGGGHGVEGGDHGGGHDGMPGMDADALGEPVYASEAPPELVASLGGLVDAEGNVAAANTGGASGHSGHEMGHELNVHATYEAASASGIDADKFISDFVADEGNFNPGQTDEQKVVGALTALNDVTAAVTMGGLGGDLGDISKISGNATNAALAGDGAGLRQILTDAGGDVSGMTDDMLVNTWSTNSHMYNHAILNTDGDAFALTHLRSLNDNAEDGTAAGTLGLYNDKGAWPQWDAEIDGQNFLNEVLGGSIPSGGSRQVTDYAGGGGTGDMVMSGMDMSGMDMGGMDHGSAGHQH